ncbi:hypothetical protein JKP88DRAFT_330938 [Tribonema minus]|uniref:Uncharacterized protein n=1 Tax=Tribonema minus TaxID=303371 RepID=A0A836CAK4_9STRA|nr:hypothetical protein JKP88DRAFT_330938 [Tribonema minus]
MNDTVTRSQPPAQVKQPRPHETQWLANQIAAEQQREGRPKRPVPPPPVPEDQTERRVFLVHDCIGRALTTQLRWAVELMPRVSGVASARVGVRALRHRPSGARLRRLTLEGAPAYVDAAAALFTMLIDCFIDVNAFEQEHAPPPPGSAAAAAAAAPPRRGGSSSAPRYPQQPPPSRAQFAQGGANGRGGGGGGGWEAGRGDEGMNEWRGGGAQARGGANRETWEARGPGRDDGRERFGSRDRSGNDGGGGGQRGSAFGDDVRDSSRGSAAAAARDTRAVRLVLLLAAAEAARIGEQKAHAVSLALPPPSPLLLTVDDSRIHVSTSVAVPGVADPILAIVIWSQHLSVLRMAWVAMGIVRKKQLSAALIRLPATLEQASDFYSYIKHHDPSPEEREKQHQLWVGELDEDGAQSAAARGREGKMPLEAMWSLSSATTEVMRVPKLSASSSLRRMSVAIHGIRSIDRRCDLMTVTKMGLAMPGTDTPALPFSANMRAPHALACLCVAVDAGLKHGGSNGGGGGACGAALLAILPWWTSTGLTLRNRALNWFGCACPVDRGHRALRALFWLDVRPAAQ